MNCNSCKFRHDSDACFAPDAMLFSGKKCRIFEPMIGIAADDLPELWEEYVGEIDSEFFEWYARYFTLEEMIEQITAWLFGGKEDDE